MHRLKPGLKPKKYTFKRVLGTNLLLVDTPGLFDTKHDIEVTTKEIANCMLVAAPGPHVSVYVAQHVQMDSRFSQEDNFRELFGSLTH